MMSARGTEDDGKQNHEQRKRSLRHHHTVHPMPLATGILFIELVDEDQIRRGEFEISTTVTLDPAHIRAIPSSDSRPKDKNKVARIKDSRQRCCHLRRGDGDRSKIVRKTTLVPRFCNHRLSRQCILILPSRIQRANVAPQLDETVGVGSVSPPAGNHAIG